MKKPILSLLLFFLGTFQLIASPLDSISTVYRNGEFITSCQVFVNASDSTCYAVTRAFDYQMKNNLESLFGWALKGMNLRKEENDLMVFYFKSTSYNKETNVIRGVGDISVPGYLTVPNIYVDIRLSARRFTNGKSSFYIDFIKSNGFVKNLSCTFSLIPRKDNKGSWYTMETHTSFGWFFDAFITRKRFKSIIEWRLRRFVLNLKEEAERREKLLKPVTKEIAIPGLIEKHK